MFEDQEQLALKLDHARDAKLATDEGFARWMESSYGGAIAVEFFKRAVGLRRKGYRHFGAKAIIESMRFDHAMKFGPDPEVQFKISNDVVSRLSRWAMDMDEELDGMFATRELKEHKQ